MRVALHGQGAQLHGALATQRVECVDRDGGQLGQDGHDVDGAVLAIGTETKRVQLGEGG